MPNCLKPKIIMYHLCQIALNQTLSCKFEKWCKISSCVEVKSHKKNLHKKRPAYVYMQQEQQTSMDATDCEFFQWCVPLWLSHFSWRWKPWLSVPSTCTCNDWTNVTSCVRYLTRSTCLFKLMVCTSEGRQFMSAYIQDYFVIFTAG
jgi:hypothetical protein